MLLTHSTSKAQLIKGFIENKNLSIELFEKEKIKSLNSYKKNIDVIKFAKRKQINIFTIFNDDMSDYVTMYFNNNIWKKAEKELIDLIYLKNIQQKKIFVEDSKHIPDIHEKYISKNIKVNSKQEADIFITKNLEVIMLNKDIEQALLEKVTIVNDYYSEIVKFITENGIPKLKTNSFISTHENYKDFVKSLIDRKIDWVVQFQKVVSQSENEIKFENKEGWTIVSFDEKENKVNTIVFSIKKEWTEQYYFLKGINNNLEWTINKEVEQKSKLSTKKKVFGLFGIGIFITLSYFTFSTVFNPTAMSSSFSAISGSFNTPWPYLLFMNYILSSFAIMIIGYFIAVAEKKKYDFKTGFNFFLSAQVKFCVSVLTGSWILGLTAWVWYMTKGPAKARAMSLLGSMSSINVIRYLLVFLFGAMFLSINSWYVYQLDWSQTTMGAGGPPTFVALSWIGLVVYIFVALSTSAIFLIPAISKWIFIINGWFMRFSRKDNYFDKTESLSVRSQQLMKSKSTIFRRSQIIRLSLTAIFVDTVLLFGLSYTFMIVASQPGYEQIYQIPIWGHVIQINSMRVSIEYMNKLNPLPGEMLSTEWTQKEAITALVTTNIPEASPEWINSAATQMTFVSRFFGFYIPFGFAISITSFLMITKLRQNKKARITQ